MWKYFQLSLWLSSRLISKKKRRLIFEKKSCRYQFAFVNYVLCRIGYYLDNESADWLSSTYEWTRDDVIHPRAHTITFTCGPMLKVSILSRNRAERNDLYEQEFESCSSEEGTYLEVAPEKQTCFPLKHRAIFHVWTSRKTKSKYFVTSEINQRAKIKSAKQGKTLTVSIWGKRKWIMKTAKESWRRRMVDTNCYFKVLKLELNGKMRHKEA